MPGLFCKKEELKLLQVGPFSSYLLRANMKGSLQFLHSCFCDLFYLTMLHIIICCNMIKFLFASFFVWWTGDAQKLVKGYVHSSFTEVIEVVSSYCTSHGCEYIVPRHNKKHIHITCPSSACSFLIRARNHGNVHITFSELTHSCGGCIRRSRNVKSAVLEVVHPNTQPTISKLPASLSITIPCQPILSPTNPYQRHLHPFTILAPDLSISHQHSCLKEKINKKKRKTRNNKQGEQQ